MPTRDKYARMRARSLIDKIIYAPLTLRHNVRTRYTYSILYFIIDKVVFCKQVFEINETINERRKMFSDSNYRQMFSMIHQARVAAKPGFQNDFSCLERGQHGKRDGKKSH